MVRKENNGGLCAFIFINGGYKEPMIIRRIKSRIYKGQSNCPKKYFFISFQFITLVFFHSIHTHTHKRNKKYGQTNALNIQ